MLKQNGWMGFPSGNERVVMEIALTKAEIERRYGLVFIRGMDGLGTGHSTYFNDDVLGTVAILCYDAPPNGSSQVCVDSRIKFNVAVPRLLEVFALDASLTNTPLNIEEC